jgi:hypothetical protein
MSSTTDRYEQRQQQQKKEREREREREEAICFCCCCSLCVGVLAWESFLRSSLCFSTLYAAAADAADALSHTNERARERDSFLLVYVALSRSETLHSRLHCNVNTCEHSQSVTT